MKIEAKAGEALVDTIRSTVEDIEEEVRERVEDAIRALDRHELAATGYDDHEMVGSRDGGWLSFDDVMDAVKRGNW